LRILLHHSTDPISQLTGHDRAGLSIPPYAAGQVNDHPSIAYIRHQILPESADCLTG
jgi:hypothetical protein